MRLTSDFWVSAFIREANLVGDFAILERRGAASGGAIFVKVDHLNGEWDLYGPAPQSLLEEAGERAFSKMLDCVGHDEVEARLEKERRFDPDLWIVTRETAHKNHGLTVL